MNAIRKIGLAAGLLMIGTLAAPQLSSAAPVAPAGLETAGTPLTQQVGWRHRRNGHYHNYRRYRDRWRYRHYWRQCRHGYWGYRCNWRSPN